MKIRWAKLLLGLLFLFSNSFYPSLGAAECLNFEGKWVGTCSNDHFIELKIKQPTCEIIDLKGDQLTIGKGYIGSIQKIKGQLIETKKMASFSPKKNKLIIYSMVTVTDSPKHFHVDIFKRSLMKKDEQTLIYTTLGKKVQTRETKIVHIDYSSSCFLNKSI
ncbi:MAG: hypothetical protein CME68_04105 [Halobacteriovoraceae bacterium]|nr:hypothetical protein [Halobacteriovoraceae bacterium]|tara:strand:+ start:318 stop:803 length:486 start_codon:yes stop_codon:yes gene_type:complete